MAQRTFIADLAPLIGQEVLLRGWARRVRETGDQPGRILLIYRSHRSVLKWVVGESNPFTGAAVAHAFWHGRQSGRAGETNATPSIARALTILARSANVRSRP